MYAVIGWNVWLILLYLLRINAYFCPVKPTCLCCQFHQTCLFSYFIEFKVMNRTEQPTMASPMDWCICVCSRNLRVCVKLAAGDVTGWGFRPADGWRHRRGLSSQQSEKAPRSGEAESCASSGLRRTGGQRHLPGMSEWPRRGTGRRSPPTVGRKISGTRPKWPVASLRASPLEAW